jgi:hypothetical protein
MLFRTLLVVALATTVVLATNPASAALLSDAHISGVDVQNNGSIGVGNIVLNGNIVDVGYEEGVRGATCGNFFTGGSVVTVNGTTATYTADCGAFDVAATVRLLSPLPGLESASGGFEREYAFTNPSGVSEVLDFILWIDQDLGNVENDIAAYQEHLNMVYTYDTAVDPDLLAATIFAAETVPTVYGHDVGTYNTVDMDFPMDDADGPFGPDDVGTTSGLQATVAAGATIVIRARTMYVSGSVAIPAAFDYSSCYTSPPAGICRTAEKGSLQITNKADNAKDKLSWKFIKGEETIQSDFGNPTQLGTYSFCAYDGAGQQLTSLHLPQSMTLWSAISDKGYKYKDKDATNSGVTKSQLKAGAAGKSKVQLGGAGTALPDPVLGMLTLPITVQFHSGESFGTCFASTFAAALENEADLLKAKTP